MIDTEKMAEAKSFYDNKDFSKAVESYSLLWDNSNKDNHNLLNAYGHALRKNGQSLEFIRIYTQIDKKSYLRKNPYVLSALCWCVYEGHIKEYDPKEIDKFDDFIKRALYIVKNCEQKPAEQEHFNPYVLTVKKVVKSYNDKSSTRNSKRSQEEIIKWLNLLNPEILSEKCLISNIDGEEYEQASSKEFYYQNIIKAYEKIGNYNECITLGEKALSVIKKFHYRNKTWIKARILYCKCMISEDIETDIEKYKQMAEKERYWFMWYKLANICYSFGKMEESLFSNSEALHQEYKYENMVNLFYNLGLCWKAIGNEENAKVYWQASAYYRTLKGWNISEELQYYIIAYKLDVSVKPNKYNLQKIAKQYIDENDASYEYGVIDNILPHGGSGFITPDSKEDNIYFSMKNVVRNKNDIKKDTKVKYKVVQKEDGKIIAICVEVV